MMEVMALMGVACAIAFGLGYLTGKVSKTERVRIPDYVPTDWKISKGK